MLARYSKHCVVLIFAIVLASLTAEAQLARVGPVDPANGFPTWYQDQNGLALDFCLPDQIDLANGICLLVPGNVPGFPIIFPTSFPQEVFYYNVTGIINLPLGGTAKLELSEEGAFAMALPAPGDQITFNRIRMIVDTPSAGTYRIVHPYGEKTFTNVLAGNRGIAYTEDIGVAPGIFTGSLHGRLGPFLRPSATRGGAPADFITSNGKTYIGDAATLAPVTGSPFGAAQNVFRIEGPNIGGAGVNFIETELFTVMGRVHTDPIPSPLTVDRNSYRRDPSGAKIDVFATVIAGIGMNPPVVSVSSPVFATKDLDKAGSKFHTEVGVADPEQLPAEVTLTNSGDIPPSSVIAATADEVIISKAEYDAATTTLTVQAESRDLLHPPTLTVVGFGNMNNGVLVVNSLPVPPPNVTVTSSAGGKDVKSVAVISVGP
ncbi:MAG TPA: hypothetical protein VFP40_04925 [Terriglobales bacterium]|nr:hypothetical protein [Terriglobales bacterium]